MKPYKQAYLKLHFAVFLFGFTAILGDLIQLSAISIVWWRVLITSFSLLFIVKLGSLFNRLDRKYILYFLGIGILVGLHWVCFYGSIKYANASIALICMATTSFFTSFLEPLILKRRILWMEILLGLGIVPAMILIVNETNVDMMLGVWVGLLSAFLIALFAVLNKKLITKADPMDITFLEMLGAWLFLSLIMPFYLINDFNLLIPNGIDWLYLVVLALVCTTLAYYLALQSLRYLSAFSSTLVVNLEPVYGILLAIVILKEHRELSFNFYLGVVIIIAIATIYPLIRNKFYKA